MADDAALLAKRECLDHFICFGGGHLDYILQEYVAFYNKHRPHQGKGNQPLALLRRGQVGAEVVSESRLGGLLRNYYRQAG